MHQQYRNDIAHYVFFSDYPYLTFPTLEQVDLSSHRRVLTPGASPGNVWILSPFYLKNIAVLDPQM